MVTVMDFSIRPVEVSERECVSELFKLRWGDDFIVSAGRCYRSADLEGFFVESAGRKLGLVTFSQRANEIEIVSLDSFEEKKGVGSALIEAVVEVARSRQVGKIILFTSNDNLFAIGFYQKRNFRMARLIPGAIDEARKTLKPCIPLVAENGIPIRDEIEFERLL